MTYYHHLFYEVLLINGDYPAEDESVGTYKSKGGVTRKLRELNKDGKLLNSDGFPEYRVGIYDGEPDDNVFVGWLPAPLWLQLVARDNSWTEEPLPEYYLLGDKA